MAETLYVRLHADAEFASWVALDERGRRVGAGHEGALAEAAAAAEGRRVVLLVPGPDVVSTQAALPATSQTRLRQMVPYSLEETLAHDVEKLFFAVGPRLESGAVSVAVVAREQLDTWIAAAAAAGLRPHAVYSEADGVPDTPGTLTLIVEDARIYGRRPGQPPFVLEALTLAQVLELLDPGGEDADLRHVLVYVDEAARSRYQEELVHLRERLTSADLRLPGDGVTAQLAATLAHRPGTNLLQGAYAPRSSWQAVLRPWRVAAGLALAFVVLTVAAQAAEYWALARTDRALTARVTDSCQNQLGAGALAECEAAARSALERAGESVDRPGETFLTTMAAVADARDSAMRIEAVSYRNRALDLQLVAPSVPALDELRAKLSATGRFQARIQATSATEAGVESRLQVVEAAR